MKTLTWKINIIASTGQDRTLFWDALNTGLAKMKDEYNLISSYEIDEPSIGLAVEGSEVRVAIK